MVNDNDLMLLDLSELTDEELKVDLYPILKKLKIKYCWLEDWKYRC